MKAINNRAFPDLHTHILPFIDDGPKSVEEAVGILLEEKRQGITDIALTPHFSLENGDIASFLKKREDCYNALISAVEKEPLLDGIRLYRGAEVEYNPNLIYEDLRELCYESTGYLLVELMPSYPFNLENTVFSLLSQGITPVLAHVERFDYLVGNKKLLSELKDAGVLFQCNATSVLDGNFKRNFKKLLKQGFVDIIASDTHGLNRRPPRLKEAEERLKKHSGRLISNAVKIITDAQV